MTGNKEHMLKLSSRTTISCAIVLLLVLSILGYLTIITSNKSTKAFVHRQPTNTKDLDRILTKGLPLPILDASDELDKWWQQSGPEEITIFSTSYHISMIADIKDFLGKYIQPYNVKIIDKSLSGHCHLMGTCAKDLLVSPPIESKCPFHDGRKLFEAYKNKNDAMKEVDIIVSDNPFSQFEYYMGLGKSFILYAGTRFEHGREAQHQWRVLNENIKIVAKDPRHVILANSHYDAHYIHYFTGVKPIVLPNYCGYTNAMYNPTRKQILVGPSRLSVDKKFFQELGSDYVPIRELYPSYTYQDLASHRAILIIPYQVSTMSFFEYYRMNIPLLAPSISLLTEWHMKYNILNERTWVSVRGGPRQHVSVVPAFNATAYPYDPNDEINREAVAYWLQFSDYYTMPNIILFDSWEDLKEKVATIDFENVSIRMAKYNEQLKRYTSAQWKKILRQIMSRRTRNAEYPKDYDASMKEQFEIDTTNNKCY